MIDVALLSVIRRWHLREGQSIRQIARRTGLSRNTVRKYLHSGVVEPKYPLRKSASKLDAFAEILAHNLATFAEFEADLIRLRTREGMAIARAKGKLRGKQPKLSVKQQQELKKMHGTGKYSISDLAELFSVSRPTVYRTLSRSVR